MATCPSFVTFYSIPYRYRTKISAHTYDVRPDGHRHHVTWTRGVSVKPYSLLSYCRSVVCCLLV